MSRFFLLVMCSCFVFTQFASAVWADPLPASEVKALNDYTQWVAENCGTPGGGGPVGPVTPGALVPDSQLPGNSRREKIWNYLTATLGFTPVQAAGIMGNIAVEGVWDPENIEDPAGRTKDPSNLTGQTQGWGLFGFTPGASIIRSGPWTDWSVSGVNVTKDNVYYMSTQMSVMYGYMKNYQNKLKDYQDQAGDSASPGDAADAFRVGFENADPALAHDARREAAAKKAMQDFGNSGGAPVGSVVGGSVGGGGAGGGCCNGAGGAAPGGTIAAGDLQSLAQRVLNNDNISFDYGPDGPAGSQFQRLANGKKAQTDDGRQVDVQPIILVALLYLAQSHKVQVSSLTDGASHTASDNPHGTGKAVDIDFLDGAGTDGSDAVADKIIKGVAPVLPNGARFGIGNGPNGTRKIEGKTFTTFSDVPNHVHVDVVDVSQSDDDKAVQAASGGDDTGSGDNAAFAAGGQCCAGGGASFGAGTLPSTVPKPYNEIFTAAASKFNVSPAFLAAVFYGGEHGNSFPDPPPPYGHGSPWATSYAGANGPFQFLTSTWAGYEQDGNGDGKKDIQDLADAAFGAADYLAELGAKNTTSEAKLRQAAADYNGIHDPSASYPSLVWAAFQKFGGASSDPSGGGGGGAGVSPSADGCAVSPGTYQNPFRDVQKNGSLYAARIDEGVDYAGEGPVYALGDGDVTYVGSGIWFSAYGPSVVYKLTSGPAQGKSVYFSENITPAVREGDHVTSNTVIAHMHNAAPNTEIGWAIGGSHQDEPCAGPYYTAAGNPDGSKMAYGANFSQLLASLGTPPGNSNPGSVSATSNIVGSLIGECNPGDNPSNWPTWSGGGGT